MITQHKNRESHEFADSFPTLNEEGYADALAKLLANSGEHSLIAEQQGNALTNLLSTSEGSLSDSSYDIMVDQRVKTLALAQLNKIHALTLEGAQKAIEAAKTNVNAADDAFHTTWGKIEPLLHLAQMKEEEIRKIHDNILHQFKTYAASTKKVLDTHIDAVPDAIDAGTALSAPDFSALTGMGWPQLPQIPALPNRLPGENIPKDLLEGITKLIQTCSQLNGNSDTTVSDAALKDLLDHQNNNSDDDPDSDDSNKKKNSDDDSDSNDHEHKSQHTPYEERQKPPEPESKQSDSSIPTAQAATSAQPPELQLS